MKIIGQVRSVDFDKKVTVELTNAELLVLYALVGESSDEGIRRKASNPARYTKETVAYVKEEKLPTGLGLYRELRSYLISEGIERAEV